MHILSVLFNKLAARLHLITHQSCKSKVYLGRGVLIHIYPLQDTLGRIHCRLPELVGIHLAETLVALHLIARITPDLTHDLLKFRVGIRVIHLAVPLDLIERRLGKIHMSLLDQFRHESVQECQHESGNVSAVDVGIGHDNDLIVAKL